MTEPKKSKLSRPQLFLCIHSIGICIISENSTQLPSRKFLVVVGTINTKHEICLKLGINIAVANEYYECNLHIL